MNRVLRKWLGRGLLATIVLAVAATTWLLGTTAGTRWLLARTAGWLPQALTLGEVEGNLLAGVHFDRAGWSDNSVELVIRDLFLHVKLQPLLRRQVRVEELEADFLAIRLPVEPVEDDDFSLPEFDLPLNLSVAGFSLTTLEISRGGQDPVRYGLSGSGAMRGSQIELDALSISADSLDLTIDGELLMALPHTADLRAGWRLDTEDSGEFSGRLDIEGNSSRYELVHELELPFAVSTVGSLSDVAGDINVDIRNEWAAAAWPVAGELVETQDGSLWLRGNFDNWSASLATAARWRDLPDVRLALVGAGDRERIKITELDAESGENRISVSGVANWAPAPSVDLEFDVPYLHPELLDPWLDVPLPSEPLRGTGVVRWNAERLELEDAEFAAGSNTVALSGSFGEEIDVDARFFLLAIEELLPTAGGTLQGELVASGTPDALTGNGSARGTDLRWSQYTAAELVANIQSPAVDRYSITIDAQDLAAGDVTLDSAVVALNGGITDHDASARIAMGDTEFSAELSGAYEASAWHGLLVSFGLENPTLGRWASQGSASLRASQAGVEVARLCLVSDTGTACLEGDYASGGPVSADIALTGVPPRALRLPIPESVRVGGTISANASGKFMDGRISGTGTMRWDDGILETSVEGERLSAELSDAFMSATLNENRLTGTLQLSIADADASTAAEFRMEDVFDTTSLIAGQALLSVADSGVFDFLLPDLDNVGGSIEGRLSVGGNLELPAVTGEVSLSGGTFTARQTGVQITDFNLTLAQLAPGQLQLRGGAFSGDGQVTVTGDTHISSDTGIRTELRIAGTDFEVARLPDLAVTASPDLAVVFDDQLTSITGELAIPKADIVVRTLPEAAVSPSRDAVVHRTGDAAESRRGRRADVDILASLGEQVSFTGFGLTAGIEGGLRIRGGTHAPFVGAGQLALRDGRYKAYGQDLEIERGELIFNGPLDNPQLNVRATRDAGSVVAGISLTGTPDNLRSEIFSEPVLSDAETLSYLLTGRPLGGSSEDGATLNKAAFALGLSGAGKVASQVRAGLGLETLQVAGGADDGRIIAGKRFGSRLMVEYGYGIIDKLGTLLLRYQLNDRLILESRTGTVSNFDIVYSVKKQ